MAQRSIRERRRGDIGRLGPWFHNLAQARWAAGEFGLESWVEYALMS